MNDLKATSYPDRASATLVWMVMSPLQQLYLTKV